MDQQLVDWIKYLEAERERMSAQLDELSKRVEALESRFSAVAAERDALKAQAASDVNQIAAILSKLPDVNAAPKTAQLRGAMYPARKTKFTLAGILPAILSVLETVQDMPTVQQLERALVADLVSWIAANLQNGTLPSAHHDLRVTVAQKCLELESEQADRIRLLGTRAIPGFTGWLPVLIEVLAALMSHGSPAPF